MQTQTDVTASPARADRYIMRRDEVEKRTGFKRAHIYNLMKEGKFPLARRIGMRAVGWDSAEIDRWIAERLGAQA